MTDWEKITPSHLVSAVSRIRQKFEASANCFSDLTEKLCYEGLHPRGKARPELREYIEALKIYRLRLGAEAHYQFNAVLTIGTPPAIFKAFFVAFRIGLENEIKAYFSELLEIGLTNTPTITLQPVEWAQAHTRCLMSRYSIEHRVTPTERWIQGVCDGLDGLNLHDVIGKPAWEWWRAPRLIRMRPLGNTSYDAMTAWAREDESSTKTLLRALASDFYFLLGIRLDSAAGDAHVGLAKKGVSSAPLRSKERRKAQQKKSTRAQQKRDQVFGAIQAGLKGRRYCQELDRKGLPIPTPWKEEECPSSYKVAYGIARWKKRIQDEKCRFQRKYDKLPPKKRESVIQGELVSLVGNE